MEISKLPKWAQARITNLEQQVKDLTHQRDEVITAVSGGGSSPVMIRRFAQPDMMMPADSQVCFVLGNEDRITIGFSPDLRGQLSNEEITIRSGWGLLEIRPRAANTVTLKTKH